MNLDNIRKLEFMTADKFKRYCFAIGLGRDHKHTPHKGYVIDRDKAAEVFGISDKTVDRYLKYGCNNQTVINLIQTLAYGCNQGGKWQGWRMDAEMLTSPYGWRVDPSLLKRLWSLRNADVYATNRITELENAIRDLHRVNQTGNNKRIIGLATELLEALNHKSEIYDNYLDLTTNNVVNLR